LNYVIFRNKEKEYKSGPWGQEIDSKPEGLYSGGVQIAWRRELEEGWWVPGQTGLWDSFEIISTVPKNTVVNVSGTGNIVNIGSRNMNEYEKLVRRIAGEFVGVEFEDLTEAEQKIAKLLMRAGILSKLPNGELNEVKVSDRIM
jgi:hypothetical protein